MADTVETKKQKAEPTIETGGAPLEMGTQIAPIEYAPDAKEIPPAKLKPCPNHLKQTDAPIQLQGDPHWRCPWCHTVLD